MIHDMITSKSLTVREMAHEAECSERAIIDIGNYLRILAEAEETSAVQQLPIIFINILPTQNRESSLTIPVSTTATGLEVCINAGSNDVIQNQS